MWRVTALYRQLYVLKISVKNAAFYFFILLVIHSSGGLDLLFFTLKVIVRFADVRCWVSNPTFGI